MGDQHRFVPYRRRTRGERRDIAEKELHLEKLGCLLGKKGRFRREVPRKFADAGVGVTGKRVRWKNQEGWVLEGGGGLVLQSWEPER